MKEKDIKMTCEINVYTVKQFIETVIILIITLDF